MLVGARPGGEAPPCRIIDVGHRRDLALAVEVADQELGPIATHELWADVYDRIAAHARAERTTIVFVNTRRLVERVAHQLEERRAEPPRTREPRATSVRGACDRGAAVVSRTLVSPRPTR